MSLGPVFYVEMLGVGRRRRYVLTRVMYGLVLLIVMGMCYSAVMIGWDDSPIRRQAEFAFGFFMAFSWVQLIGVLFLTPAMTAGTIAGEHERRTIDYLLTTSLTDVEITLGKFVARMLAIAAQLSAGLPILAIAMTLGGIGPEQLFQSFAISLASLASVGGLSLAVSAQSRTSREAIVRAYIILIGLMVIPPVTWALSEVYFNPSTTTALRTLTELNPVVYLAMSLFDRQQLLVSFPYFTAAHLAFAVATAGSTVFTLRRYYKKQAGKAPPQPRTKKEKAAGPRWSFIPPYSMLWKEVIAGRGAIRLGWLGRLAAIGLYGLALWGLGAVVWEQVDSWDSAYRRIDREAPHIFGTAGVAMIGSLCLLLVAGRAAGSITSEREQDTWLTLTSTPLPAGEIVWAKFVAAIYSVRWWYLLIALGWLLCVVITPEFFWAVPILLLIHAVLLSLTAAIGVLCSLTATTSLRAMGLALAVLVLVLSIGPVFCAILTRTEELIGFSLPAILGGAHYTLWQATDGSLSGHDSGMAAVMFAACLLYGFAAAICYGAAVANFDAFTGRTTPRLDQLRDHFRDQPRVDPAPLSPPPDPLVPPPPIVEPEQGA